MLIKRKIQVRSTTKNKETFNENCAKTYTRPCSDGFMNLQGPENLRGAEHHLPRPLLNPLASCSLSVGLSVQWHIYVYAYSKKNFKSSIHNMVTLQ